MIEWSEQQQQAAEAVSRWLKDPDSQLFYLAGYAGTGKTTLAQHLAREVSGIVLFAAFTGKAASVLRRKGATEARTLHSILYDVADADRTRLRELKDKLKELNEQYHSATDAETALALDSAIRAAENEVREEMRQTRGPRFSLNSESIMKDANLLVLDECSMVDQRLGEDALSFKKKVLVLGDPAQLPPVQGKGFFTRRDPDFLLTQIHRQAQDNAIIRAATAAREGRPIPYGDWGDIKHLHRDDITMADYLPGQIESGVQVLCGKNETRRKINKFVRRQRGYTEPYPMDGETLVILRNDKELGVLNGVVCEAASDFEYDEDDDECILVRLLYEGNIIPITPTDRMPFDIYSDPSLEELYSPGNNRHLLHADFGYALTVHKAQGSEWDKVLFIDDGFGRWKNGEWMRKKWLYTGITRAANQLVIVS